MSNAKLSIVLTENFRLTSDDKNFTILERKFIYPTKSPNWPRMEAEGADPTPRESWREDGYYPMNTRSLVSALDSVILREATKECAENGAQSLMELTASIRSYSDRVYSALTTVIQREKYGQIAEKVVAESKRLSA